MPTTVLGPSHMHSESGAVPAPAPIPGKVGVQFDPSQAVRPGGSVGMQLQTPVNLTDEYPSEIYVVYIPQSQLASLPTTLTVAAVQSLAGLTEGTFPVPAPPPAPMTTFLILAVPPPSIGVYLVQSLVTYPT